MKKKPVAQAMQVDTPVTDRGRKLALMGCTVEQLKRMARATGISIPKTKDVLAERLTTHPDVVVAVTTEAFVMLPEREARQFNRQHPKARERTPY